MSKRNQGRGGVAWLVFPLMSAAVCLMVLGKWIDQRNDAELDQIEAEMGEFQLAMTDAIGRMDQAPRAVAKREARELKASLETLSERFARAKQREESPFSGERLALHCAHACVLAALVIYSVVFIRRFRRPERSGQTTDVREA